MKKKKDIKKLPWTSDLREIERRMVQAGLMDSTLIWSARDLKHKRKKQVKDLLN